MATKLCCRQSTATDSSYYLFSTVKERTLNPGGRVPSDQVLPFLSVGRDPLIGTGGSAARPLGLSEDLRVTPGCPGQGLRIIQTGLCRASAFQKKNQPFSTGLIHRLFFLFFNDLVGFKGILGPSINCAAQADATVFSPGAEGKPGDEEHHASQVRRLDLSA